MSEDPGALVAELDAITRVPALPPPGASADEAAQKAGWMDRLRGWLDRLRFYRWLRDRFIPWLEETSQKATAAYEAFWNELTPAEQKQVKNLVTSVKKHGWSAARELSANEAYQIAVAVRLGLAAAADAWNEPGGAR